MKKIWGFKLKRFKPLFSKHLKQKTIVSNVEMKLFSDNFVVVGIQRSLVNQQLAHS
jgi:hypothetical protein